jgi:DivIVA domain-containing protein
LLTPADVRSAQFTVTGRRPGYDQQEVDTFLARAELGAGLVYAEFGYALRASAGPARTQARPAAPAGGPQAGQPGAIRQQLGDAAGARNGDDRPDPAAGQRQPFPRSVCRGVVRHATHAYHSPSVPEVICWLEQVR